MATIRKPFMLPLDEREKAALEKVARFWGVTKAGAARRMILEKAQLVHLPSKEARAADGDGWV